MFNRLKNNKGFVFTSSVAALTAAGIGATAAAVGAGVVTAGVLGLGAYAVNKLTQKPKTQSASGSAGVQAAEPSYDRASALAQGEADDKRRAIARNKTQYTTPQGLTPTNQSNLNLKTLTGV